ncbi:MAG TPA: hypothetical protein VIF15_08785 [Polyangiaceae bacterium]
MSADNDRKADPGANGAKPAVKTVVGVPALPPADRPSDMEMTRELPPQEGPHEEEPATALDVKAMSTADAERVLASAKPPGVAGALPRPPTTAPMKTAPPPAEMFVGLGRPKTGGPVEIEKPTRPGVAPQPGVSAKGRSTLLLDSSVPPTTGEARDPDSSAERPPIVVPATGAMAPKAVTQPPPWGEGAARVAPSIPHRPPAAGQHHALPIEEISSSLLLPDASGEAAAQNAEELSGSVLIEEPPDGKGPLVVTRPGAPSAPPRATPSVKPPVPKSSSGRPVPHAHRSLLGMPELPKSTPAPNLDLLPRPPPTPAPDAQGNAVPPPDLETPPDLFAGVAWPPPPAQHDQEAVTLLREPAIAHPGQSARPPAVGQAPSGSPPSPVTGDIEVTRLPRGGLQPMFEAVERIARKVHAAAVPAAVAFHKTVRTVGVPAVEAVRTALRKEPRPKWFLPAVAGAGLVVGIGMVGLIVGVVRRGSDEARDRPTASSSATPGALPGASASSPVTPPPSAPALAACTVAGSPHVIAPGATVAAGVEIVRLGDDLALGFAPTDHDAIAVRFDAASMSAITTAKAHAREIVHRVTPLANAKGSLSLVVDTDRKNDHLQGRRTVLADPPLQLGAADGHVAWAPLGRAPAGELWPVDDPGGIEALRGAVEGAGEPTVALAFRRGGAILMGTAAGTSALAPKGNLSRVEGLGTAVGSPAIAVNHGVILVAWSDRPSSDDPWHLRWVRFQAGEAPGTPTTFAPPPGGKGGQAMSPGLAALPGGRFLLVWTEGPASGHDVRAITLSPDGTPIGAPLEISNAGNNAGQGQAAVTAGGQGAVAFLESGGSGFQVVATPIACGP